MMQVKRLLAQSYEHFSEVIVNMNDNLVPDFLLTRQKEDFCGHQEVYQLHIQKPLWVFETFHTTNQVYFSSADQSALSDQYQNTNQSIG